MSKKNNHSKKNIEEVKDDGMEVITTVEQFEVIYK